MTAQLGTAEMAIVLGSGLMDFVDKFDQSPPLKSLAYGDVPFMPGTNVPGHSGRIYTGNLKTKNGPSRVMCFAGRVHAYEGWNATEFNFIVRLAHSCGVKVLLLTNSAGGALAGMTEGSIMMIEDHIRFSGVNPLKDVSDDRRFGEKHCTSSFAYSKRIQTIVREAAAKLHMPVLSGTYCWTSGPSYETPSEVKAGQLLSVNSLGGAFGMSTVPEVLAAHNLGMEVFAVSLCTNLAAGLGDKELTHGDVKIVAETAGPRFQSLLLETFANLSVLPEEAKKVLPTHFDAHSLPSLAAVPSQSLRPVVGWTPSVAQVYESIEKIARINTGAYNALSAAVLFLGGRQQSSVQAAFLASLSDVKTVPLRDLSSAFATHSDMVSSYARTALFVIGSLPAPTGSNFGKRVIAVASPDGNGLSGFTSAEHSWLVQVLSGLGISTILASGVGVDTRDRDRAGVRATVPPVAGQVVLVEDVLDRQIDPLPLTAIPRDDLLKPVDSEQTPVFDQTISGALQRAFAAEHAGKKHAPLLARTGAYISFQGPMLPTEAELNMAVHAGAVATAGISNLSFVEVAKELGLRVGIVVRTVARVTDLPEVAAASTEEHNLSSAIAHAMAHVLASEDAIEHIPRNTRIEAARASAGAVATASGYGPVSLVCHQETFSHVRASADFLRAKLGSIRPKSLIAVEGMLQGVFAEDFTPVVEFPILDVPHFAQYLGIDSLQSGTCAPYDPRVLMSSWSVRIGTLASSGASVMLLSNSVDRSGMVPMFHGLNYLIRCAKLLEDIGLTNVLLLTPLASCTNEVAAGSLVGVKDHINFTGLNPLFGENTAEFGPRFNDMSVVYKPSGLAAFTSQSAGSSLVSTITVQVPNPSLGSLSEAALCRSMHGTTVVAGFAPLATICKHQDTFVTAIGYVYRTAGTNDDPSAIRVTPPTASVYRSETRPTVDTINTLRGLVHGAVDRLHEAGVAHIAAVKEAAEAAH